MDADVLVVGAGPAGLAVAACLRQQGVEPRRRRPRRRRSASRGDGATSGCTCTRRGCSRPCPGCASRARSADGCRRTTWPSTCAGTPSTTGSSRGSAPRCSGSSATDGGWTAVTGDGKVTARQVVVASGYNCTPVEPVVAGPGHVPRRGDARVALLEPGAVPRAGRAGRRCPATPGRRSRPTSPQSGAGARLARGADAAERRPAVPRAGADHAAGRSRWSTPPPGWSIRSTGPCSAGLRRRPHAATACPRPRRALVAQMRATGVTPTIDVGLIKQLRAGRVTPVAAVDRFEGGEVVLGRRHPAGARRGDRRDRLHDRAAARRRPPRCARRAGSAAGARHVGRRRRRRGCASSGCRTRSRGCCSRSASTPARSRAPSPGELRPSAVSTPEADDAPLRRCRASRHG